MSFTEIQPLSAKTNVLSVEQFENIYQVLGDIIDNLDDHAIKELASGDSSDVDHLFSVLLDETAQVLASSDKLLDTSAFGYLDKFSRSVEETLRVRSLNYFILSCLPDFLLAPHNIEWGNLIQAFRLLNILASRDSGKSHMFSFAYILWQMYRYRRWNVKDPARSKELFYAGEGMLVTNEYRLAIEFLSKIKGEIESNDILGERLLPSNKRDNWGKEKIVGANGAKVYIRSANSKIRGLHPKWIVLDDFLNESSLYSREQRERYWNIFVAVILPALSPGGAGIVVGTPFQEDDLYGRLKKIFENAKAKNLPASELKNLFRTFEFPAIFPDGTLLFPQRHSYESIMAKKEILGPLIFSREIMVKPITDDATIFPYSTLLKAIKGQEDVDLITSLDSVRKAFSLVVVGCDFAISSNIGSDYSVFTIVGVDELERLHVLNCWIGRGKKYHEQIAVLKKINRDFRPDLFVVEINGMQEIFLHELEQAGLPVVGDFTGNDKKSLYTGVPSLAILFERDKIKFPYGTERAKKVTDRYFAELNSITFIQDKGKLESTSQKDDTSMSLWQAVKGARRSIKSFDFSFLN